MTNHINPPKCECVNPHTKKRREMVIKGNYYYCINKRSGCGKHMLRSTWEREVEQNKRHG